MSDATHGSTIGWYRTAMPAATLKELNRRSDIKGLIQAGGFLGILCVTAGTALYSAAHWPWYVTLALVFLHGTCSNFHINGVHELVHNTVFKSKWLNGLFIRIFGFLGWNDWVWFNASHANHHRYTLHPPRDLEVVLPIKWLSRKVFWKNAIWAPLAPYHLFKGTLKKAMGHVGEDAWTQGLFPADKPEARRKLRNWNLAVVLGHSAILIGSIAAALITGAYTWLLVPVLVSFGGTYGGWLFFLCNNTQHVGLTDKVPDFRLCCRSMKLPFIVSFLYWRMEYHTEHHMYAAVPCYNLPRLNRQIRDDLPKAKGLLGTWQEIAMILKRQEKEPDYQYQHPMPASATPAQCGDREAEILAGQAAPDPVADCDVEAQPA